MSNSLELARLVKPAKLLVEGREQLGVGGHILAAHGLPDGVHGERWNTKINSPDANLSRDDGSNGGTTWTIIPDYELLQLICVSPSPDIRKIKLVLY